MSDDTKLTTSGIPIPVTATAADAPAAPGPRHAGEYPFTRGVYPTMYRGRLWTMRQYAGFGTAAETNRRFKYLLQRGQTGLSVAFDLATQIGYDSDHPMAAGEVGRTGVAIDSLADMEKLFDGIPLDKVSTSMTINAPAVILLAMYIAVGRKQGVPAAQLSGTVQNDVLKEFIARGTYILPPKPSMKIITDIFAYAAKHLPKYNTISISGYHIREAGSTAAQEVAFTLANAVAYVEAALAAGLSIDDFAPRLSFFFAAHNDLFEEVAKFRAARQIWAELVRDRFRSRDEKSMLLRFHTQTGGSTLTAQQPENNIVRTAIQALAGVLGGTQSLHTNSYDEALGLPTEKSVEIALRTQQIIAHESGAAATVDPLGGSYYIEYLTAAMDKRIRALLAEIESRGGAVACIENGYFRDEIAAAAYDFQRRVETRRQIVVGVNEFTSHSPGIPAVLRVDPELERNQVRELAKLKATRDRKAVAESLAAVRDAARQNKNVVEPIIDAVAHYATVGEISDIFREVWGEYHENL
ncbi:MAG TPA: methylmalonyl-CoA mutase family protein [candidate division Zixibacteria bacterium]|nr:methylmalonyl-CoA mutase [candidate division Zixibacteria bacterium]MDD4916255.1 methylmalonyl-CoA mutase family protein [candidate division Zixibacteria bacterium]MDM7973147.1 methylmalonyl-CoA mutase family protein [candidate division Zixibacteria bacterium]HOD67519.1 methylmalonyl-CoA mutase family protein [candidate division Zixibacteria bacterium]HPC11422.1 methylmalonyl-CoA mutase family protein [candidate division Zixibacteria bacterium]